MICFQGLTERMKVDRIEDAFFQYAVLKVCCWYPKVFSSSNLALHHDTVKTLEHVTAAYHGEFTAHYASKFIRASFTGSPFDRLTPL